MYFLSPPLAPHHRRTLLPPAPSWHLAGVPGKGGPMRCPRLHLVDPEFVPSWDTASALSGALLWLLTTGLVLWCILGS